MRESSGTSGGDVVAAGDAGVGVPSAGAAGRDAPIIVHCHLRWDFVWQRPQQIFSRLAAHHPVLFVEEPMWLERGEAMLALSTPQPGIVRAIPKLPPSLRPDFDAQVDATRTLLARALQGHPLVAGRFDAPIQWFQSPMTAPGMLGRFGEAGVVYDCMDELAAFRFAPVDIVEREQLLLARADVVFTGGYQLFVAKSRHHRNVHFHGCGVDVEHFRQARQPQTEVPAAVRDLPRPILGYFGVIDERIDYALVQALAMRFPDASVVMAGPFAKVDPDGVPRLPNIHWLGQQAYEALPALLKSFDVCLMPFALNEATRHINPTKTLEYMAGGKPIVSTAVPDVVRNFTPIVRIADGADDFVAVVESTLRRPDTRTLRRGIARANAQTWDAIVAQIRSEMLAAIGRRRPQRQDGAGLGTPGIPTGAATHGAVAAHDTVGHDTVGHDTVRHDTVAHDMAAHDVAAHDGVPAGSG